MNKVILMGRLTRDPEVRYSSGDQKMAVCNYTIAVNRAYKREGEADADFINITAFGQRGDFAGKYFKKGMQVAVVGELRISSYDDKDGNRRWVTNVVVSEQFFAEGKKTGGEAPAQKSQEPTKKKVAPVQHEADDIEADDDLPF